jgi:uncharacterized protein YgiM (DUF1202 family)
MSHLKLAFLNLILAFALPVHAGWFDSWWQPQQAAYAPVYVRASAANVRSAPTTQSYSDVFGTFAQNTPLQVVHAQNFGSDGTWYFVRSKDGREGWVNGHLLAKNPTQRAPASTPVTPAAAPHVTQGKHNPTPAPPAPVPAPAKPGIDTLKHCVSQFNSGNAQDKAVMAEMSALTKGDLNATGWSSPRGTGFSFSNSGGIVITINSLPPKAIQQLSTTAGVSSGIIQSLVQSKAISFNAKICVNKGKLSIALTGTGTTDGKTGFLALTPSKNNGFQATGEIAGSSIRESFTKASR